MSSLGLPEWDLQANLTVSGSVPVNEWGVKQETCSIPKYKRTSEAFMYSEALGKANTPAQVDHHVVIMKFTPSGNTDASHRNAGLCNS